MSLKHDDGWNIPPEAPFYPPLPAVYRNVRFHFVFFTAKPEAVGRSLPEPLEPASDGLCAAVGMAVPFCTNYGAFEEAFTILNCTFRGKPGWYCSHVFHNGPAGIAAGREIYGTPKVFAQLSVQERERSMFTDVSMGGCSVMRVSTITEQVISADAMPALTPAWRLKIIPRADGPGPAIKQLIDCARTTQDAVVHFCSRGRGTVAFGPSPYVDLTGLKPVNYRDAYYLEMSYSEYYAEVAYDYLKEASQAAES